MLQGGLKFREGYGRKAYNNILVNNGFHPARLVRGQRQRVLPEHRHEPHAPIGQPDGWGKLVDRNLFISEAHRAKQSELRRRREFAGRRSDVCGSGGRRLPCERRIARAEAGIQEFPDGPVRREEASRSSPSPRRRSFLLSRSRKNVAIAQPTTQRVEPHQTYWLGASLSGLEGEGFSAFGVSKEDGGVHLPMSRRDRPRIGPDCGKTILSRASTVKRSRVSPNYSPRLPYLEKARLS